MPNLSESLSTVALVAVGVLVAGYIMNVMYDSIPFVETASDGFDM